MAAAMMPFRSIVMALCSVLLISIAQLSMKWGMSELKLLWPEIVNMWQTSHYSNIASLIKPTLAVFSGLTCYGLSMAFWVLALKKLPLSVAYPLLSISYVLVYLGAVYLPWLNEPLSWSKAVGILLILIGLIFVFPRTVKKYQSS